MIRSNLKEEWLNSWATGSTGRSMYAHMAKPQSNDPINRLKRKDQSLIFQLRSKHAPLNQHLNRIGVKESAACPLSGHPNETVEHHLFDFRRLTDLRGCFLPRQPNMANCLYSSKTQLEQTCNYSRIALGRRANAQRLLDRLHQHVFYRKLQL